MFPLLGGLASGNIQGTGNQDGSASSFVGANAGYPQSGVGVGSAGESKATNGTPSMLSIDDKGALLNGTGIGANGLRENFSKKFCLNLRYKYG